MKFRVRGIMILMIFLISFMCAIYIDACNFLSTGSCSVRKREFWVYWLQ